jgi:L-threonylcarbamoyladenylate synthase
MPKQDKIEKAVEILKSGGVIAFPTETVFGIGAMISNKKAVKRIYELKKRPLSKPLQVLVADLKQARSLGYLNKEALELAKSTWPGPLTLVVKKKRTVPSWVVGGGKTVGLRIPDHKTALSLLKLCGPLAATSANLSEEKPALSTRETKKILPGIDYIIPGKVKTGKASRVIDTTKEFKTLRS